MGQTITVSSYFLKLPQFPLIIPSPPAVFTSSLFTSPHNQASNSTTWYKLFSYQRSPMTTSWPFFLSQFFLTFLQHLESRFLLAVKSTLGFISVFSEITLGIQSGISGALSMPGSIWGRTPKLKGKRYSPSLRNLPPNRETDSPSDTEITHSEITAASRQGSGSVCSKLGTHSQTKDNLKKGTWTALHKEGSIWADIWKTGKILTSRPYSKWRGWHRARTEASSVKDLDFITSSILLEMEEECGNGQRWTWPSKRGLHHEGPCLSQKQDGISSCRSVRVPSLRDLNA